MRKKSILGPQERALLMSTRRAGSHESIERLQGKGSRERTNAAFRGLGQGAGKPAADESCMISLCSEPRKAECDEAGRS